MKRIHLFEFTDLTWYPPLFRRMQTDYLQFVATLGRGQKNLVPLLEKAMQSANTGEIVDLCSGGTGPWLRLKQDLEQAGLSVEISLTDKYPDPRSVQKWSAAARQGIRYLAEPVDATNVPPGLGGMRTLFEGFHHFRPEQAKAILRDAMDKRAALGIFEISLKPPLGGLFLLLAPLSTLLSYLFMTPFIRPRTLARFFWTYLIPIVPLATCWDGIVSLLRVYSTRQLEELAASLLCSDYAWEIGEASTGTPIFTYVYLIGYPIGKKNQL